MTFLPLSHRVPGRLLALGLALCTWLAGSATAAAMELGGQFGFGAGLAVGTTHQELGVDSRPLDSGGGGVGFDLGARLWSGPLLVGGTATVVTTLLGTTELMATGGAGVKLDLGERWRLTSLIEGGVHQVRGLGNDLFADSIRDGTFIGPR